MNQFDEYTKAYAPADAAPPTQEANPFDAVVKQAAEQKTVQDNVFAQDAIQKQPDRQIEYKKLADKYKVPTSFIENNYDSLIAKEKKDKLVQTKQSSAALDKWMTPDRMALAHDDLDNVKKVDTIAGRFKYTPKKDDSFIADLGYGVKTNYINVGKSIDYALALSSEGQDLDDRLEKVAATNRKLQERMSKDPEYYKVFREKAQKLYPSLQISFAETLEGMEKVWDGKIKEGLLQVFDGSTDTVGDFVDVIKLYGSNPKALAYGSAQSLINSYAPMVVGVGTAYGGALAGTAAGGMIAGPAGAGAGAIVGGTSGFAAGATASGMALEFMLEMEAILEKNNVDTTDGKALAAAFRNPKLIEEAKAAAARKSFTTASVEALVAMLGGKMIAGGATKGVGGAVKGIVKAQAVEVAGEAGGEYFGQVAREKSFEKASVGEALEEGASALVMMGGIGSISYALSTSDKARQALSKNISKAATQVAEMYDRSNEAIDFGNQLNELGDALANSKFTERDRAAVAELVTGASENSAVFMQADDFENHWKAQGVNPVEKAEILLPGGKLDLEKAKAEGKALEIPLGHYVNTFTLEDSFSEINKLVKRDATGINAKQAEAISANIPNILRELSKEVKKEKAALRKQADERQAVVNDVQNQMIAAGVPAKEAKLQAEVYAANVAVMSEQLGITPVEFYRQKALEIKRFETMKEANGALFQRTKDGLTVRKGETIKPGFKDIKEVNKSRLTPFTDALNFKEKKADLKTKVSKLYGGKTLTNTISGKNITMSEASINGLIDKTSDRLVQTVNRRKAKKSDALYQETLTAIKNLPTLIQDAAPTFDTEDGKEVYFAVASTDLNDITVKLLVNDKNEVEDIEVVAMGQVASPAGMTQGQARSEALPGKASIQEVMQLVNGSRSISKYMQEDYRLQHRAPGPDGDMKNVGYDLSETYPDIYGISDAQALRYYGYHDKEADLFTIQKIREMAGDPDAKVTIYRAVPEDINTINTGDWVTLTMEYAEQHIGDRDGWHIISEEVTAKEIFSAGDIQEWGYHEGGIDREAEVEASMQEGPSIKEELSAKTKELNLDIIEDATEYTPDYEDLITTAEESGLQPSVNMVEIPGIEGPRRQKAIKAGFNPDAVFFHGSRGDIEKFSDYTLGASTGAGSAKLAHFFTTSPSLASDYAEASDSPKSLQRTRVLGEASKKLESFKNKMRQKYGAKWVSNLDNTERTERKDLLSSIRKIEMENIEEIKNPKSSLALMELQLVSLEGSLAQLNEDAKDSSMLKRYEEILKEYEELAGDNVEFKKAPKYGYTPVYKDTGKVVRNSRVYKDIIIESQSKIRDTRIPEIKNQIQFYSAESIAKRRASLESEITSLKKDMLNTAKQDSGQVVYPVVLKMQRPLIVDFKGEPYREVTYRELIEKAKERGYDSVVFKNTYDPAIIVPGGVEELVDVVAVFDGRQVRSTSALFEDMTSDNILAQDDGEARGFLDISDPMKMTLGILAKANKSTMIHEFGHAFLENLKYVQSEFNKLQSLNPQQQKFQTEVIGAILEDFGLTSLDEIEVQHHERFARLFEAYAMEGKAPTPRLQKAFNAFKTWLVNIYKNLAGISKAAGTKLELSPEMTEVFNRLLATQEEINEVEIDMSYEPGDITAFLDVITTRGDEGDETVKKAKGASDKDREEILQAHEEARSEAELTLYRKHLEQIKRRENKDYKADKKAIKEAVTLEANNLPVYKAVDSIKSNQINGQDVVGYPSLKMNEAAVRDLLTAEQMKSFPRSLLNKEGIDPNITADLLGYNSAADLLDEISTYPNKDEYIRVNTEHRLDQKYPNFMSPSQQEAIKLEAIDAVYNKTRAEALQLEFDYMMKNTPAAAKKLILKALKKLPNMKQVAAQADKILADTKLKDSRPGDYQRLETKNRKEAMEYLTKGKFVEAAKSKMKEMLNHQLQKKSAEFNSKIDKAIDKNKKRLRIGDKDLAKKGNLDMFKTAQAILAKYGLATETQAGKLDTFLKQLQAYDPGSYHKVSTLVDSLVDIAAKDYKELTKTQLEEVLDTVDALYTLAVDDKKITVRGEKFDKEKVIADMSMNLDKLPKTAVKRDDTKFKKFKGWVQSLAANMTRVEHLVDTLDLGEFGGPFRKYMWTIANDAQLAYNAKLADMYGKLNKILDSKLKNVLSDDKDIRIDGYFPGLDPEFKTLKKSEVVMALIHSGNDSNKRKLLLGRNWGFEEMAVDGKEPKLNTAAYDKFIADMIAKGVITKDIMDGVQAVWDLFEEIKPDIQKAHKDVYGYYFKEIEAKPIQTPWGEYRGGYAPAVTDPLLVEAEAGRQNELSVEQQRNQFEVAHTPKGFTKERIQAYNKALSLNFQIIRSHVEKAVRFATIEKPVTDLNKIVNNRDFADKVFSVNNSWGNEVFRPWLARLATQRTTRPADTVAGREFQSFLGYLRRNANQQLMFFNIINTVENLSDIPALFTKMKARSFMNGLSRYVADPKAAADFVSSLSPDMKDKMSDTIYEINDAYKDMLVRGDDKLGKIKKLQDKASKHAYILQKSLQNVVEVVAWLGAYDEAFVKFQGDQTKAVEYADSVIKTVMGSNRPIDMAKIEAGDAFQKIVLTFYSYFLNKGNLVYYSKPGTKAKAYALGMAAPAILAALFRRAVKGNWDDDGDDEYIDDAFDIVAMSQLRFTAAVIPFGGATFKFVEGQFNDVAYDDRLSISPMLGMVESVKGVKGLMTKEELKSRDLRDAMNFFGMISGMPVGSFGKPVGYFIDVEKGKQPAEGPVDVMRGITTGRAK